MHVFALLPAGGTSSRMGRNKLALMLDGRTVLERVIDAVRAAEIPNILVVLGPQSAELQQLAEHAGACVLALEQQTQDMRATIERGLRWLIKHENPNVNDALLLLPADHPTLSATCIQSLLRAAAMNSDTSIWVPIYEGRRGHPALISWRHVPAVLTMPSDRGLNTYLRAHANDTMEVTCSPEVLCDLDTPEDWARCMSRSPGGPER